MNGWLTLCWMGKWLDGWINGWMDGWMNERINEWMDDWGSSGRAPGRSGRAGWMNEWMDDWMDGWPNGWMTHLVLQHEAPVVERKAGLVVLDERGGVRGLPLQEALGHDTRVVEPRGLPAQQLKTSQTIQNDKKEKEIIESSFKPLWPHTVDWLNWHRIDPNTSLKTCNIHQNICYAEHFSKVPCCSDWCGATKHVFPLNT